MKVTSMRGVVVDMARYLAQNEDAIAIGNGMMNARGDLIGPGGRIVKKREEVAADYHRANPKAVRKVALKDLESEVFASPAEAVAAITEKAKEMRAAKEAADAAPAAAAVEPVVEPVAEPTGRRRKISESDT